VLGLWSLFKCCCMSCGPNLSLRTPTITGFCETATHAARVRDPAFPTLLRWLEDVYFGPAEVARQTSWRAGAKGLDLAVECSFFDDGPVTARLGTITSE
jgi:hypothetical protein